MNFPPLPCAETLAQATALDRTLGRYPGYDIHLARIILELASNAVVCVVNARTVPIRGPGQVGRTPRNLLSAMHERCRRCRACRVPVTDLRDAYPTARDLRPWACECVDCERVFCPRCLPRDVCRECEAREDVHS